MLLWQGCAPRSLLRLPFGAAALVLLWEVHWMTPPSERTVVSRKTHGMQFDEPRGMECAVMIMLVLLWGRRVVSHHGIMP